MSVSVCHVVLLACAALAAWARQPAVLVVSFDGFRYNYFDKEITPNMDRLKLLGTHAEYMRNVFPTKTFPNHHSIATGVFPEVHGVLASKVYDPVSKKVFQPYDLFHYNEDIVPIWTVNEGSPGTGHHSGVMMWPGGDVKFHGLLPTFYQSYNYSVPWEDRINTVMGWFRHPDSPANLVFMYLEDPDRHAHVFGPESPEVLEQIRRVDNITRYLHDSLNNNNLSDVNVLLVSDHGMETVTAGTIINLEDAINKSTVKQVGSSPVLHLIPDEGTEDQVYNVLKELSQTKNFSIYRKAELPDRWHIKNNKRTPPLMLVADEGYAFHDMKDSEIYFRNKWKIPDTVNMTFGVHGYDPREKNMRPFFMAWGPQIKKNHTIPPFDTVDLYSLISKMLDLQAPKTNGSADNVINVISMMTPSSSQLMSGNMWFIVVQMVVYFINVLHA